MDFIGSSVVLMCYLIVLQAHKRPRKDDCGTNQEHTHTHISDYRWSSNIVFVVVALLQSARRETKKAG